MMEKKLKICMLIPSYLPLVGGSEVQLSGLLKKLNGDRVEPFVLTRRLKGTPAEEPQGIATIYRKRSPLRPALFFFSSLLYLLRNRQRFDVIHVHSFDSPALAGAIIKRLFPSKRFILLVPRCGEGSAFNRQQSSYLGRRRFKFVLSQVDAVIPLCAEVIESLRSAGLPAEKIAPIPNGVDADLFQPPSTGEKKTLRASLGIGEGAFVGVFMSRLIPRKNVIGALEAWRELVKTRPNSVLIIAGTGPEELPLKSFAKNHLPARTVIFYGAASRDAVPRILKTADVYVSFSESEGMSNAMLEAFSTGLPIVAARGPGIDSLITQGECGILVDPSKPRDGAGRLEFLSRHPVKLRQMSASARQLILEQFSFEIIARRMEALYYNEEYQEPVEQEAAESTPEELTV
jgi:glycosyltransferase involved in cell wall biosynthesis